MTNPRLAVDFAGILTKRLTFKIDNSTITYDVTQPSGSAQVGLAVTLESDAEIGLADDGEAVVGLLETVYLDGAAVVAVVGAVLLPVGTGDSVVPGGKIVGAQNATSELGYVQGVHSATAAELAVARGMALSVASDDVYVLL